MKPAVSFIRSHLKASFLFLTIFFFTFIYFTVKSPLWLLAYLLLCIVFMYFVMIYKGGIQRTVVITVVIFLFPVVVGLGFLTLLEKKTPESGEKMEVISQEECAPIYEEYHGKVLDIKADGLIGQAHISINQQDCKAEIAYVFQFSASLEVNESPFTKPYSGYFVEHTSGMDRKNWSGNGQIGPAYKNIGLLPSPSSTGVYEFYVDDPARLDETTNFYHTYKSFYTFSGKEYENLFKNTKYYLLDGREFIETVVYDNNVTGGSLNASVAGPVAPIVKEFDLKITERD